MSICVSFVNKKKEDNIIFERILLQLPVIGDMVMNIKNKEIYYYRIIDLKPSMNKHQSCGYKFLAIVELSDVPYG